MDTKKILDNYWEKKLNILKEVLEKNQFEVFLSPTLKDVKNIFIEQVLKKLDNIKVVSFGGSLM